MSQDIFIKIDGIDGESPDAGHENEIEVIDWDWEVRQDSNMHKGSGGGSGKATVEDLRFTHYLDRASPNLMKYCLTGKHIPETLLTVRKAGGSPLEYLKLTLTDVVITRVRPVGASSDARLREDVSLSFSKVKQEYTVQNQQGGSGGAVTAGFDIKANKEA